VFVNYIFIPEQGKKNYPLLTGVAKKRTVNNRS
jgi:hypothetical protein